MRSREECKSVESEKLKEHLLVSLNLADSQDLVDAVQLLIETPKEQEYIGQMVIKQFIHLIINKNTKINILAPIFAHVLPFTPSLSYNQLMLL